MKIAYFTPLSPLKSGISEYSERELLPFLKKYCNIDIIIDKGYEPISEYVKNNFKVSDYNNFENNYDCVLYQMGNNPFHEYIYETAIKIPGVVVLHDPFLHHLIRHLTVGKKDRNRYIEIMQYCLGIKGKAIAEQAIMTNQFPLFDYPVIKELIDSSSAVIVHSDYAEKTVKDESPDVLVKKIKMPITIPKKSNINMREKLNIPQDFTVIGTFGNIGFYKRLNVCLKSFYHYHKKNPKSVFMIVGSYLNKNYKNEIYELVKELNISNSVIETGYVDDLFPYVEISDIITQLRYPTAGETSIITLQILGIGKPVIVSKIGSFSELPDDSIIKIEPDVSEEVSIYNAFLKLTDDESFHQILSSNAKKYIEQEHDPEKIAKEFYEFISTVPKIKTKKTLIKNLLKSENQSKSEELEKSEPFTEDEINVTQLELKNVKGGKGILKGLRSLLHKEIRDWIVFPFQKKQTRFNRKAAKNISIIHSKLQKNKNEIITLRRLIETAGQNSDKKVEDSIHFNLARRIDSLIEEKFISLRETFEIENKVKKGFLEILNRYPTEVELKSFVNKIKNHQINLKDLEVEIKKLQN